MADMIKDGRGRGFLAAVNSDQQLITRATAVEQRLNSTIDESYYEATTGQVTLVNATETGIIYIQNDNADLVLVIDRVFYDLWETTGGSNSGILRYYLNPTVTGGTAITPNNTNFGSRRTIEATCSRSLTTMTGTVWWTAQILPPISVALEEGRIVIPSGSSFGISIQAPTGNTSMALSINVAMYNFDPTLIGVSL